MIKKFTVDGILRLKIFILWYDTQQQGVKNAPKNNVDANFSSTNCFSVITTKYFKILEEVEWSKQFISSSNLSISLYPSPPLSLSPTPSCLCVRSLGGPTIASTDMEWVFSYQRFMALILSPCKISKWK